jgi:hypothetical protein
LLTCVEGLFKTQEVSVKWVIDKKYVWTRMKSLAYKHVFLWSFWP